MEKRPAHPRLLPPQPPSFEALADVKADLSPERRPGGAGDLTGEEIRGGQACLTQATKAGPGQL